MSLLCVQVESFVCRINWQVFRAGFASLATSTVADIVDFAMYGRPAIRLRSRRYCVAVTVFENGSDGAAESMRGRSDDLMFPSRPPMSYTTIPNEMKDRG